MGYGMSDAIYDVFGSWNSAKAVAGLAACRPGTNGGKPRVLAAQCSTALAEWHKAHGDLPTYDEVRNPTRAPRTPSPNAILSAYGVTSWPAAMRSAVEHLGIKSERYGSPRNA